MAAVNNTQNAVIDGRYRTKTQTLYTSIPPTVAPTPPPQVARAVTDALSFTGDNSSTTNFVPGTGFYAGDGTPTARAVSGEGTTIVYSTAETVNSFIVKTREQYVSSLPMRFTGATYSAVSFVANLLDTVVVAIKDLVDGKIYVQADYTYQVAITSLNTSTNGLLDPSFVADLALLPSSYAADQSAYQNFVRTYGTHVMLSVKWGGRLLSHTSSTPASCGSTADALLVAKANEMLNYAGQVPGYPDSLIQQSAGGPGYGVLQAQGFAVWKENVTINSSIPIDVELADIYDARFVSDANKRVALEECIADMTPWTLPIIRIPACVIQGLTITAIVLIVVFGTGGIAFLSFGAWWYFKGRHRKALGAQLEENEGRQAVGWGQGHKRHFQFSDDASEEGNPDPAEMSVHGRPSMNRLGHVDLSASDDEAAESAVPPHPMPE